MAQVPAVIDIDAELIRRQKIMDDRLKAMQEATTVPMITVIPTKPEYRQYLKHEPSGIGFGEEGGAEWPNDQFTKRRVRDGAVKLEEKKDDKKVAAAPARPAE